MSKILVIGARGRAGRAAIDEARRRGHEVIGVARTANAAEVAGDARADPTAVDGDAAEGRRTADPGRVADDARAHAGLVDGDDGEDSGRVADDARANVGLVGDAGAHAGLVDGDVGADSGLVVGDVTDAGRVAALAVGRDAVVVAVYDGGADPGVFFPAAARAIVDGLSEAGVKRLVWVGLASILPTADGTLLMDSPGYPQEYRSFYLAHQAALDIFAQSSLDWVSIAPAGDFNHAGPARTGSYRIAPADATGLISYADLAIALVDEVDQPAHHRTAIGVVV